LTKKRFYISLIQLVLATMSFVVVSLAWFVLSTEVSTAPIEIGISPGYIKTSELTYYTPTQVFRYDDQSNSLKVYDNGLWVDPVYTNIEDSGFDFNGIFIKQYDPIIDANNFDNFLFLELRLTYEVEEDKNITMDLLSDTALATAAKAEFGFSTEPTSNEPYYLSEVSYIQYRSLEPADSDYNYFTSAAEGFNLFNDLKTVFSDTTTYPLTSFYGDTDTYTTSYRIDQRTLGVSDPVTELYFYFKFSYYTDKIETIIANEFESITINGSSAIRFFQDIKIQIKEDDSV